MNILSEFDNPYRVGVKSRLQIGEEDGRFYIVGTCECHPDSPRILKEITAQTLDGAVDCLDNTESLDFRPWDLRYCSEDDYTEDLEEMERLKAEHEAEQVPCGGVGCMAADCSDCNYALENPSDDDRTFSVNGKPVPTWGTED